MVRVDLGMPLEEIQAVLSAPDLGTRNQRITAHLRHLEEELGRVQSATASLRDLDRDRLAHLPDQQRLNSAPPADQPKVNT